MTTERTCLADRVTKSLLGYGVTAALVYVISVGVQMATRDGYDPTRHVASQLANGDLGWVQIATFEIAGAMTIAAAVGIRRALGRGRSSAWGSALIGGYGLGLMAAGMFRADPSDGFPPGTPAGVAEPSWHGVAHFAAAGLGFVCLVAACFVLGARFARDGHTGLAWFSRITGAVFAGSFVVMSAGPNPAVILLFTAAVVLAWVWLAAVSATLYRAVGAT